MAEKLAFEQCFGERAAVDGYKRPVAAVAPGVNGLGHQFLSGSSLALQQYRGIHSRDEVDKTEESLMEEEVPIEILVTGAALDLVFKADVFVKELFLIEELFHKQLEPVRFKGLDDEVVGPALHGLDCGFNRPVRRDHHDQSNT